MDNCTHMRCRKHSFLLSAALCVICLSGYVGCTWMQNNGLWYYISSVNQLVDYQQAAVTCKSMNAHLAVIASEDQNDFLSKAIDNSDNTPRWIGLSNVKTETYTTNCKNTTYVWSYDWWCQIAYTNYRIGYKPPDASQCIGVSTTNGKWSARPCTNAHGFICQWACKRVYMHFESMDAYSGIYKFEHYWHGHIEYAKDDDAIIEIYKTGVYNGQWVVSILMNGYTKVAFYDTDSYVPYGKSMTWVTESGQNITSGSFCIDCDTLFLRIETPNGKTVIHDHLFLRFNMLPYPTYIDENAVIVITYDHRQYMSCVDGSSLDVPARHPSKNICGYIFPYPDKITTIKHGDKNSVFIKNTCITTLDSDRWVTSSDETKEDSADKVEDLQNNTTPIVVAVSVIGIIIVITVAAIVYICLRRNLRKRLNINKPQARNTINSRRSEPHESHIYLEIDRVSRTHNVSYKYSTDSGEYSYVDVPGRGICQSAAGRQAHSLYSEIK